jgi:hypothetical protein
MSQPAGKPPAPEEEKVIERPGFVWKHGHWDWGNNQWNWIGGQWMPEQSGKTWRDGDWTQGPDGAWHWHDGSWVGAGDTPK